MTLFLDGHDLGYEMRCMCFLFFQGEKIETVETQPGGAPVFTGDFAFTRLRQVKNRRRAFVLLSYRGKRARAVSFVREEEAAGQKTGRAAQYALGRAFYKAASQLMGFCPPWGVLTGIRPAKIARERLRGGDTPAQAAAYFENAFYVRPDKAKLCAATAREEEKITALSTRRSASLYISIPFCPTRCLYCSFISHDVAKSEKLLPAYVELLCREIEQTGALAQKLHLRIETVYMGGGTPTTLSAEALTRIFDAVRASFTLENLREYTVEAGRPDTITPEKLAAIKAGGAGRICINPQTMDDSILRRIGRNHTAAQTMQAFEAARRAGIGSINMDLIAGLPGDTPEGFARTLDTVLGAGPDSVTVHTLAMKRSSRLVTSGEAAYDARGEAVDRMLIGAGKALDGRGYAPYYLYRQRNTAGNLENTGFARPGHECLYNIFIMDETHSILAVGAGGVTKLRQPGGDRIERVFNFKYPYEYIGRFEEILDRKKQVEEFYVNYDRQDENRIQ